MEKLTLDDLLTTRLFTNIEVFDKGKSIHLHTLGDLRHYSKIPMVRFVTNGNSLQFWV